MDDIGLWERFGAATEERGLDRSAVLREFIRWYVGEPGVAPPARPESATRTDDGDHGERAPHSAP
jgi:hypothetical protein